MILNILYFIFGTFLIYLSGYTVLRLFKISSLNLFAVIPVLFGLGSIFTTLVLFILSMFDISWSLISLLLIVSTLFLLVIITDKSRNFIKFELWWINKKKHLVFPVFLFCIVFFFVTLSAVRRPVVSWDSVANWFMTGKSFYVEKRIDSSMYKEFNFDVPPALGIQIAFYYLMFGQIDDRVVHLIFPLYYINLLFIFYALTRLKMGERESILATFLFALTQKLLSQAGFYEVGYADLILSFYFLLNIYFYFIYRLSKVINELILLQCALGFLVFVKNEGVLLFVFMQLALLFFHRNKMKLRIFYSFVGLLIAGLWYEYKELMDIPKHYMHYGVLRIQRLPLILQYFIREAVTIQRWNLVWLFFLFASFMRKKDSEETFLFIVTLLLVISYILIYLFTPIDLIGHIVSSIDRFYLQTLPVAMLFVSYSYRLEFLNSYTLITDVIKKKRRAFFTK